MTSVAWTGPAAPAALAEALRTRGVRLVRAETGDTAARLIYTASPRRVPKAPAEGRWIWIARGAVTQAQRTDAILRGAYDVIDLRTPSAADDLAARLEELAVREPPAPS